MSSRYETVQHRAAEGAALAAYGDARGLAFVRTPHGTAWDAEIVAPGDARGLVEVKCRAVRQHHYATYQIDRRKIEDLVSAAAARGVQAAVLVQFQDALVRLVIDQAWLATHAQIAKMVRKDRDDPHDTDVAYEWSNDLWRPVSA